MPNYVAVVGLDYPHAKTGEPIRLEPGDEVHDLNQRALARELEAGNICEAESAEEAATETVTEEPTEDGAEK